MKKLILTTTALALSASMAFAGGHGKTVRMGTEGAYPPYNFINDKGEVDGFERELGDELCKRAQLTDFTQNYTQPDPSAYLAKSADVDLAGGVLAAQTGTIQAAFVAQQGWTLLEFATPEETVAAVRNGEADALLADKSFLKPIAEEDAELMLLAREELIGGGVGMGLRESDGELRAKFDAAIQSMKDDGTLNALIVKWEIGETF
jgi:polar amino acid transport system substrate-binding protein